jgi:hypothetical protein
MAKNNTKKQSEEEAFEELRRKALEPFKPLRTMEDVLKHEEKLREESLKTYRMMKKDVKESEKENIKSRAFFEKNF